MQTACFSDTFQNGGQIRSKTVARHYYAVTAVIKRGKVENVVGGKEADFLFLTCNKFGKMHFASKLIYFSVDIYLFQNPPHTLKIRPQVTGRFMENQLTLKCTARSACMHYTEKMQKNQLVVKCTTQRSKLLKFIFRKNYYVTFWWKMEITDLLGLILEMSMHNFVEIFLE